MPTLEETKQQVEAEFSASTIEHAVEMLGGSANAKIVYGEPVTRGDVTVIPVARARMGFGMGGGRSKDREQGAGGGGGLVADPVGYIEIRGSNTTFRRTGPSPVLGMTAMIAVAAVLIARIAARGWGRRS